MTTAIEPNLKVSANASASLTWLDAKHFDDLRLWLKALGDIPLSRVVTDPWIGTATEKDLLRICETGERLVELVDGTLLEKPVGIYEARIAARLIHYLLAFVIPRKLGDVAGADAMYRLRSGRVRLPDVSFISAEALRSVEPMPPIPQVPFALAVEVLSEGNTDPEMRLKLREYFDSGTRLMWIVDPKTQTVAVFDAVTETPSKFLTLTDTLDGGEVLPGFTLPLNQLFTAPI